MDQRFDRQHHEIPQTPLPEIATALFNAIGTRGPEIAIKGIQLADSLINDQHQDLPEEDKPVLGLSLLSHFSVSDEQKGTLLEMIRVARLNPKSMTSRVIQRIQVLHQGVGNYFQTKTVPYDFVQIARVPDIVAMSVLTLESHRLALEKSQQLKEKNETGLIVPFIDPFSGEPGVWMSSGNIPFDESKLQKSQPNS